MTQIILRGETAGTHLALAKNRLASAKMVGKYVTGVLPVRGGTIRVNSMDGSFLGGVIHITALRDDHVVFPLKLHLGGVQDGWYITNAYTATYTFMPATQIITSVSREVYDTSAISGRLDGTAGYMERDRQRLSQDSSATRRWLREYSRVVPTRSGAYVVCNTHRYWYAPEPTPVPAVSLTRVDPVLGLSGDICIVDIDTTEDEFSNLTPGWQSAKAPTKVLSVGTVSGVPLSAFIVPNSFDGDGRLARVFDTGSIVDDANSVLNMWPIGPYGKLLAAAPTQPGHVAVISAIESLPYVTYYIVHINLVDGAHAAYQITDFGNDSQVWPVRMCYNGELAVLLMDNDPVDNQGLRFRVWSVDIGTSAFTLRHTFAPSGVWTWPVDIYSIAHGHLAIVFADKAPPTDGPAVPMGEYVSLDYGVTWTLYPARSQYDYLGVHPTGYNGEVANKFSVVRSDGNVVTKIDFEDAALTEPIASAVIYQGGLADYTGVIPWCYIGDEDAPAPHLPGFKEFM